jgi:hypothetical protein
MDQAARSGPNRGGESREEIAAGDQRLGVVVERERFGSQRDDQAAGAEVAGLTLGQVENEETVRFLDFGAE